MVYLILKLISTRQSQDLDKTSESVRSGADLWGSAKEKLQKKVFDCIRLMKLFYLRLNKKLYFVGYSFDNTRCLENKWRCAD